jgi:soluble lytic murein transglycosylase-like protein
MFSIRSLSIRRDTELSEMILRVVSIAIGVVVAMPAQGQAQAQPGAVADAADEQHQGYRLAQTADGFQLVEHGVWEVPAASAVQASVPSPITSASDGMRGQKSGKPRGLAGPNGFRRAAYLPHVYAAEARFGLPAGLLDALIWTESRYNPFAISRAGAAGLGQLMPGTAKELGVSNRFDPLSNLAGAARYLRQMLDRFGTVHMALAAYNAGPGAVERAGGIPLNGETPSYVRDVLRRWRP